MGGGDTKHFTQIRERFDMSQDSSRRRLLAACGVALGSGLSGCLFGNSDTIDPGGMSSPPPNTTTDVPDSTQGNTVDASIGAASRYDGDVMLTVEVRRNGNQVLQETKTVLGNVNQSLGISVETRGDYTVLASLEGSAEARYDWQVTAGYDGQLEIRITSDGTVAFREHLSDGACTGDNLPYTVSGNEQTHSESNAELRNDSGRAVEVNLSIAHDKTEFFDCTYDLDANQSVSLNGLTATAGEYTVVVDIEGGGRTEYDWRIPPEYAWPRLLVVLPANGDPLAGCGEGSDHNIGVRNQTSDRRDVTLTLARDGEHVVQQTTSVEANAETTVTLSTPIGGFYVLSAETDAGSDEAEHVDCYCYSQYRTTVTLDGESPNVESRQQVCD